LLQFAAVGTLLAPVIENGLLILHTFVTRQH